ncbi:hypothetical protein CANCADRAFT_133114 [Tortispora caseinolytica NRRL Y-17796]|uniref:dynamin GTPase n=1 Tax=Tortispora caseinolytica NRRL Y-17796 TaxID=767744 RepID=A0A1E4TBA7_9ASCO|nr:hypothetical protein CANCADRAFT_133114 [Tortispora caseinolytica NRRL Y-17796]
MSTGLEALIPVVNRLQDLVFNTIGSDTLDLPQVVVVGSQSSGKTSVLENIVGRDFLPRGSGIVTRRPLILQLINVDAPPAETNPTSTDSPAVGSEWGEFLHLPGRKFYDFSDINREIQNETLRLAGNNKGISRQPINLKIFSPHVVSLTLVDLPGLTKIPIGDQPTDIERQTRSLILEYIAKPNSIILAVSPANVDIVNSESLKLARQVDPDGKRTVGVLTKLDLMDHGTHALDILSGRVYPLKLGFIALVNRSQQDIQTNLPLKDALRHEQEYFDNHSAYRNISHRCGTLYLTKTLNTLLMNHIRDKLPDIKARLNTLMGQTEQELASYGETTFIGKENRGSLILQLMTKFATSFIASIDGTSSDISVKELCGGARIYYIYNDVYGTALSQIDPTADLSTRDIRTAIRNSTGPRASLFVPELAFDLLVRPQITLLAQPSQRCVELVYEELMKVCHNCGTRELSRYPRLQAKLIEVVSELLRERLGPTSAYVESLIAINQAYVNTNHPSFVGAATAMTSVLQDRQSRELDASQHIKSLRLDEEQSDISSNQSDLQNTSTATGETQTHSRSRSSADSAISDIPTGPSSNGVTSGPGGNKDSFLNYFFGKEDRNLGMNGVISRSDKSRSLQVNSFSSTINEETPGVNGFSKSTDDENLSDREYLETELIRRLITSYFNIVREMIQDQVPKAVMHLLVNFSKESIQNRLVAELYKESLFDELLHEDDNLAEDRAKCAQRLETYRQAAKIVSEVI